MYSSNSSMSSPYMAPRYGIWGENPYGAPTALGVGMSTSQGLGNIAETQARAGLINSQMQDQNIKNGMLQQVMPGLVSSTNATDAANTQTAVPDALAKLGLLNYKNQYFPENEDIALADSITKANQQAATQSRFGSAAYNYAKIANTFTAPIKNAVAANNPGLFNQLLGNMAQQLLQAGSQSTGSPSANNAALQILGKYHPGLIGSSAAPTVNSVPTPSVPVPTVNGAPVAPTIANANAGLLDNGQGLAPGTTDAIKNTAQAQVDKANYSNDQQKRIAAGNRLNVAISQIDGAIPSITKYSGIGGWGKRNLDAAESAFGHTNPDYQNYLNMQNVMPLAKGDLSAVLSARATDMAAKDINQALDVNNWSTNPKAAQASWNNLKSLISKTEGINKQPINQQVSNTSSANTSPNTGWNNGQYVHSDGKSYSRAELEAIAKGGK